MSRMTMTRPEIYDEHHTGGYRGVHDLDVRLEQMDREGITAELVYHGDARVGDIAHNITNSAWAPEVWDAGARAYNRWVFDTFGSATDRLLLVGAMGSGADIDGAVEELRWLGDHGFRGTYAPGFVTYQGQPPLFDEHWEPYWAECAARGLAVVVHAGYGFEQGVVYEQLDRVTREVQAANGTEMDLIMRMATEVFGDFFADVKARQPMWQLMYGGVFDRHPDLKLVLTEIRLDWIPANLAHLDAIYDAHRAHLPGTRRPSEYWHTNCLAGASFVHKVEIEMRHEIGVDTILFGRDYPHPESTWPNTPDWLRDCFHGVPEDELRLMLGENAIRFFGLEREPLAAIAEKIGPTVEEVAGSGSVDEELLAIFDARGGYLKPAEGDLRIPDITPMLERDLATFGSRT
jgi:predicted TIM-barrel fold metal-dependent hydrolase